MGRGRNFIGTPAETLSFSSIQGSCPSDIYKVRSLYFYEKNSRTWVPADTLYPGQGYVIYSGSPCTLVYSDASQLTLLGSFLGKGFLGFA